MASTGVAEGMILLSVFVSSRRQLNVRACDAERVDVCAYVCRWNFSVGAPIKFPSLGN